MNHYTRSNYWRLFFMIALLGIVSIGLLSHQSKLSDQPELSVQDGEYSYSDVIKTGTISSNTFANQPITFTEVNGLPMVEGDIILRLDGEGHQTAGTGVPIVDRRWKDGLVAYAIDPTLPDQYRVQDAIEHWETETDMRFVLRDENNADEYPDYVYFRPSNGCSSYVGRMGSMQPINLALGCTTGSTIHEIGHAVGLWHEQSRIDREDYVTIHYDNIMPEAIFNFNQHITDGEDIGDYDFDSIMHYPKWAFSKNGKDTIEPKFDVEIGQRQILSQGDIDAVAYQYRDIIQVRLGE